MTAFLKIRVYKYLDGRVQKICIFNNYENDLLKDDLCKSNEKELFVVELKPRQQRLITVLKCPLPECIVRGFQTSVVSDVLAQRLTPFQLQCANSNMCNRFQFKTNERMNQSINQSVNQLIQIH